MNSTLKVDDVAARHSATMMLALLAAARLPAQTLAVRTHNATDGLPGRDRLALSVSRSSPGPTNPARSCEMIPFARRMITLTLALLVAESLAGCSAHPDAAAARGTESETAAASAFVQPPTGAADSAAIMAAMSNWEKGWEEYDAELSTRDYSDDADWTNAFGNRAMGRDSIRTVLTMVYSMPAVTAGRTRYEYHALRFLGPDVALLRSRATREGQQLADGSSPPRHINHLRVFARRDGRWQIVSHLIGDERTPGQPR